KLVTHISDSSNLTQSAIKREINNSKAELLKSVSSFSSLKESKVVNKEVFSGTAPVNIFNTHAASMQKYFDEKTHTSSQGFVNTQKFVNSVSSLANFSKLYEKIAGYKNGSEIKNTEFAKNKGDKTIKTLFVYKESQRDFSKYLFQHKASVFGKTDFKAILATHKASDTNTRSFKLAAEKLTGNSSNNNKSFSLVKILSYGRNEPISNADRSKHSNYFYTDFIRSIKYQAEHVRKRNGFVEAKIEHGKYGSGKFKLAVELANNDVRSRLFNGANTKNGTAGTTYKNAFTEISGRAGIKESYNNRKAFFSNNLATNKEIFYRLKFLENSSTSLKDTNTRFVSLSSIKDVLNISSDKNLRNVIKSVSYFKTADSLVNKIATTFSDSKIANSILNNGSKVNKLSVPKYSSYGHYITPAITSTDKNYVQNGTNLISGLTNSIKEKLSAYKDHSHVSSFTTDKLIVSNLKDKSVFTNSKEHSLSSKIVSTFSNFFEKISETLTNNKLIKFAAGGYIQGKGSKTSDSIIARVSKGEYVIKAASVDKYGVGFFDRLNAGAIPSNVFNQIFSSYKNIKNLDINNTIQKVYNNLPRFAGGGLVGSSLVTQPLTNISAGNSLQVYIPKNIIHGKDLVTIFNRANQSISNNS
nr:hypothetical protein [Chitinophagaceae bacterium]